MEEKRYVAIDLKSFYASVECVERGLDPLTAFLVVADEDRTEKTICLAVTPALKQYGISSRPRLLEVKQRVGEINAERNSNSNRNSHGHSLVEVEKVIGSNNEKERKHCKLDYIIAKPRMSLYIEYSTKIYNIYLKYFSKEDIHVYSIDEVFIDITPYIRFYEKSPYEIVKMVLEDIVKTTG